MDEAFTYPLRGEHAEKALLTAWICVFVHTVAIPFLVLVPLFGYAASVLTGESESGPPPFLERAVLYRGIGATVLVFAYGVVPTAVTLVTVRLLVETSREPTGGGILVLLVGSTTVLFVLAVFAYVLPIALANYVHAGTLRGGLSNLAGVASHAVYFVGWCSGVVLLLVGLVLSSALVESGGVLTVLGAFVGAYSLLVATRRIGRGYAGAST